MKRDIPIDILNFLSIYVYKRGMNACEVCQSNPSVTVPVIVEHLQSDQENNYFMCPVTLL